MQIFDPIRPSRAEYRSELPLPAPQRKGIYGKRYATLTGTGQEERFQRDRTKALSMQKISRERNIAFLQLAQFQGIERNTSSKASFLRNLSRDFTNPELLQRAIKNALCKLCSQGRQKADWAVLKEKSGHFSVIGFQSQSRQIIPTV